ncbi:MAG: VWA domain-containing protein [Planctomycetota bacterium]
MIARPADTALRTLEFAHPMHLLALWGVPIIFALLLWLRLRSAAKLGRFADDERLAQLAPPRRVLHDVISVGVICLALALCVVALARPRHSPEPREVTQRGRDVVFVVDVSRSMLARDLAPDRLGRAKLWIRDLVHELEGHRVGLVAFAGESVVKCPLTLDRGFFDVALEDLGPAAVSRGGTLIGDAIRVAVEDVLNLKDERDAATAGTRDVILITDGEDQGSFPVEAADRAGALGVRVIALGLGSSDAGATVLDAEGKPVLYNGEPVRSRLDPELMRQVAAASRKGAFLNVGDGAINLDEVYRDLTANTGTTEFGAEETLTWQELFQPLLGAAAILLGLEPLTLAAHRRRRNP